MGRPRPNPPFFVGSVSNFSKIFTSRSAGMPVPVSRTQHRILLTSVTSAPTVISPADVYFIALDKRFWKTCVMSTGSAYRMQPSGTVLTNGQIFNQCPKIPDHALHKRPQIEFAVVDFDLFSSAFVEVVLFLRGVGDERF